jgi:uncharacterized tellurite resistance protein B-like protein
MFFRRTQQAPESASTLLQAIQTALPKADPTTHEIVTAIVGLFGCVSYADREFSEREQQLVRNLLQTMDGISTASADAILTILQRDIIKLSTTEVQRFARTLVQHAADELRMAVLDMLLDIAAVDHDVSNEEVTFLRQITKALGLQQSDYNALQLKHRTKLRVLKLEDYDAVTNDAES